MPDVLPLLAIAFQSLFLLVAIAIEANVFRRLLTSEGKPIGYKTSAQYAMTVNLLATVIGWLVFFLAQPFLPGILRIQLISFIFFDQFLQAPIDGALASSLVVTSLIIFLGVYFLKLESLNWLEWILEKPSETSPDSSEVVSARQRRKLMQSPEFQKNSRAYGVLVANAASFAAILLLLYLRSILAYLFWR
jgi:hypothetical protein